MKKVLVLFFVVFASVVSYSQVAINSQVAISDSGNHSLMLISTKENPNLNKLNGSPYLQNEFQYGTVEIEGKEPLLVFLRYDVVQEQIEIKTDSDSDDVYVLPKNESAIYIIEGKTFIFDQIVANGNKVSGYFINYYDGETFKLLKKPFAKVNEAMKAKTGYDKDRPARIEIDEKYYVINQEGQVLDVRLRHRDIKKSFNSDRAKNYLSDNKIRSEEDLIAFISFLDKQ